VHIAKFELLLHTQNSFALPTFKGSTFRGKFGHTLKRTICIMSHRDCDRCEIREKCAYTFIFKAKNERGEEITPPFIIEPPLTGKQFFLKGEKLHLGLTLIGKAIEYLPYFIYTFIRMGQEGIGRDRGKYELDAVRSISISGQKVELYDLEKQSLSTEIQLIDLDQIKTQLFPQITIHFLTPTQIKKNGKMARDIDMEILLSAILRRYHRLRHYYTDENKEKFEIDWKLARQVKIIHQELRPVHFKRFSNRQKRPVPVDGITGKITFSGNLTPFYPWLKIGEFLHVGKGAVFGLGWYRVV